MDDARGGRVATILAGNLKAGGKEAWAHMRDREKPQLKGLGARRVEWGVLILLLGSAILVFPWLNGDGKQYYMTVRTAILDGDLNYYNEFAHHNPGFFGAPTRLGERTASGYVPSWFSVGPSVFLAPFYAAGLLATRLLSTVVLTVPDGYGPGEIIGFCLGSCLLGLVGLYLSYRLARRTASSRSALGAMVLVWVASSVPAYLYVEPSYAHALSILTVAVFLWLWWHGGRMPSIRQGVLLGLAGGAMTLVRWQDAVFLLLPLVDLRGGKGRARRALALGIGFGVGLLPQAILWYFHYGRPLLIPQGEGFLGFWRPDVQNVLFSPWRGLFCYTPVALFAVVGLRWVRRDGRLSGGWLLGVFALQVYVNSITADWFGGWAFGARRFVSCAPMFVLGLACLLDRIRARAGDRPVWLVGLALALWNLLMGVQYYAGLNPRGIPVSALGILAGQWEALKLIGTKAAQMPGLAAAGGMACAGIGYAMWRLLRGTEAGAPEEGTWQSNRVPVWPAMAYLATASAVFLHLGLSAETIHTVDDLTGTVSRVSPLTVRSGAAYEGIGDAITLLPGETKRIELNDHVCISEMVITFSITENDVAKAVEVAVWMRDGERLVHRFPETGDLRVARQWLRGPREYQFFRTPLPLPLYLYRLFSALGTLSSSDMVQAYEMSWRFPQALAPAAVEIWMAGNGGRLQVWGAAFR